jgi:DNA-directed RNA polymerase subunit M/transcription elongation factor TFIIS
MGMFKQENEEIECETCGKEIIVKQTITLQYDQCPHCLKRAGNPYAEENMKLLNEPKNKDGNKKLRLWEIKTKIVYEDDYETDEEYEITCEDVGNDGWMYITSDSGWNGHGGYSMYQKVED